MELEDILHTAFRLAALIVILALPLLTPVRAGAQMEVAPAAVPAAAGQRWSGVIILPTLKLPFVLNVAGPDGATLDIPMQGLKGGELHDVGVSAEAIRFTFKPPGVPESAWAVFSATIEEGGAKAAGTLRQGGMEYPITLERLAEGQAVPTVARAQDPKGPYPYSSRDVSYTNAAQGNTLAGTLTIPEGPGRHPAVILISGSGPQDRNEELMNHRPFLVIADHLSRRGIAVLRMDDRGVGGSTLPEGATHYDGTTLDFAEDVLAGIEFLKTQADIDDGRIGLIGHSEGGLIAPIVASRSADVRFVVLLAGTGVPLKDVMVKQLEAIERAAGVAEEQVAKDVEQQQRILAMLLKNMSDEEVGLEVRELGRRQREAALAKNPDDPQMKDEAAFNAAVEAQLKGAISKWFRVALGLDPREYLRKTTVPVLVMNGEKDLQVLPDQNIPPIEAALREAGNTDVTIKRFPDLNHLFQHAATGLMDEYATIEETFSPEALGVMTAWLRSRAGLE